MSIPLVEEATVIGIMPAAGVEVLCIAMIAKDCANMGENAHEYLSGQLRRQLPTLEIPLKIVLYNAFPRTPSGKIERSALKDRLLRGTQSGMGAVNDAASLLPKC
jgi:acyl-coenzyme A synthetase/AMP-(fatty) acid ligase